MPRKSMETSSSSVYSRMPFMGPSAAWRMAALMVATVAGFSVVTVRSTTLTFGRGHAHGVAVELALQFRNHQVQRLGRSRGRRNHRKRRGARAAQVLVRQIEQLLVVGVGVDRGHGAVNDAESFEQHLGDRRQAIRGARRVRNHVVLRRVVGLLIVHAQHQRVVGIGGRRRDDHFLHRAAHVLARIGPGSKQARWTRSRFARPPRPSRSAPGPWP